jgi:peptidyl-prolyl cis-trans isomerase SurA
MWVWTLLACGSDPAPPTRSAPEPAVPEVLELPPPTEERYAGSHILLAWRGALQAPASVARTEAEAEALARSLHEQLQSGGDFAALARAHSDGPSAARGGRLGTWQTGTMLPAFERAVASVEPGALAPVTRSPFGWHVIRRDAIEEVTIAHVLVAWQGARRSSATRDKASARALADDVHARLTRGEPLASVARELSDDGSAASGGSLGRVARGQMVPAFEDAAFALSPGELSAVVETPYGFHVLKRTD